MFTSVRLVVKSVEVSISKASCDVYVLGLDVMSVYVSIFKANFAMSIYFSIMHSR